MNQEIKTNDILPDVVFKTKNIIIQKIKEGSDKKCILIGKGNSLSVNENNEIVSHDPGMKTLKLTLIPMQQFIHFTLHLSVLV